MSLDELVGGPDRTTRTLQGRGVVQQGPDSNGTIHVTIEGYSETFSFDIPSTNWMPRPDRDPAMGDSCLVVLDHLGDAWVPAYG